MDAAIGLPILNTDTCRRDQMQVIRGHFRHNTESAIKMQGLLDILKLGGDESLVLCDDPGIERPTVPKRHDEARRIDDGRCFALWNADGCPITVRQIDVSCRKRPGDK